MQTVFTGVSKKFGFTFGKPGNLFAAELGEWNNCHKLIQNLGYDWKSDFSCFSKVPFVGTLKFCLKMADTMQKTKIGVPRSKKISKYI